jgi:hypothetical protein
VLERIGPCDAVICSANGTWIDRSEAEGVRQSCDGKCVVSAMAGYVPELFSVTPLLGIAATVLTRRVPRLLSDPPGLCAATGHEAIQSFAALVTDFTGCASGTRIELS